MAATEPEQQEAEAAPIPIASPQNTVKCDLNSKNVLIGANRIWILAMTPTLQSGTSEPKALTIFLQMRLTQ